MDLIMFVILLLFSMITLLLAYKIFNKEGLYYLLIIMIIISFFLSFKIVSIWGFDFNANVLTNTLIFSIIYLLMEKNKKKENKKILQLSILTIGLTIFSVIIMNFYIPSVNDTLAINMRDMIFNNYKIMIVYPVVLIGSEITIMQMYNNLKRETYESIFIISSIFCLSLGLILNILFNVIGYLFILDTGQIIRLILMNYLVAIFITVIHSLLLKYIFGLKKVNYE